MSEEQTAATPSTPGAPAIDMAAIKAEAAREAEARANALFATKESELTEKITSSIVERISGKPKEPELDPTVQKLLTEPETVLGHVARRAVQDAVAEMERKQELRQVVNQTFESREDLKNDPIAQRAIGSFYAEVQKHNPEMADREVLAQAVKMFDQARGTKTQEETPTVTGVSSGGSPAPANPGSGAKSEDELLREELQSKLQSQNAKRLGFSL